MTMIEALLSLPEDGELALVGDEIAAALKRVPTRFASCLAGAWLLTGSGRCFLAQFRNPGNQPIKSVTVRLVVGSDAPVFHLFLDNGTSMKVPFAKLQRSLEELRAANPGVQIAYAFRPFTPMS